jgi:hypothetical protein
MKLNGQNSLAFVASSPVMNPGGDISVEAWFYPTKIRNTVFLSRVGQLSFEIAPQGQFSGYFNVADTMMNNSAWVQCTSKEVLRPNRWYYIVLTFSASRQLVSLYINGVLNATASTPKGRCSLVSRDLYLGYSGWAEYASGLLGGVALLPREVQEEEIQNVYRISIDNAVHLVEKSAPAESVSSDLPIPNVYSLRQNYPNPFNGITHIRVELPKETMIDVRVYDILGREVGALIDHSVLGAGVHDVPFSAGRLASGIYIVRMTGGGLAKTITMCLDK